jgi:hypothetical protein
MLFQVVMRKRGIGVLPLFAGLLGLLLLIGSLAATWMREGR